MPQPFCGGIPTSHLGRKQKEESMQELQYNVEHYSNRLMREGEGGVKFNKLYLHRNSK